MEILLVRHGQSEGNAAGRMQGNRDSPLTSKGRSQAECLGLWLAAHEVTWDAAYCSPLQRARTTADIVVQTFGASPPIEDEDLREIHAGALEGMSREEIDAAYPDFAARPVTGLGDFSEYGGEGYDDVQRRVERVRDRLLERHAAAEHRVLVVAHGGLNFQLLKFVTCVPVPRVCVVRWGNCTTTLLRFRERRGQYLAEVAWHVPVELMGGRSGLDTSGVFR